MICKTNVLHKFAKIINPKHIGYFFHNFDYFFADLSNVWSQYNILRYFFLLLRLPHLPYAEVGFTFVTSDFLSNCNSSIVTFLKL